MSIVQKKSRPCGWDSPRTALIPLLYPDHAHQLLHRTGTLLQRGFLLGCEFDFDDLLDTSGAQFARHTDKKSLQSIFAFEIGSAGQDLLLVFQNGLDHFGNRRDRKSVV